MNLHRWACTAFLAASAATAGEYFVAPDGKDANSGAQDSPWPLKKANAEAKPGDTIVLADGTYTSPIAPARSGEDGKPIAYRAAAAKKAVFTAPGGDPKAMDGAVLLSDRSHVVVDGIAVKDVHRFVVANGAAHVTIQNCRFENGPGWEDCRFQAAGNGIRLLNNFMHKGTDLVSIQGGENHLIEGNFFGDASHTGLVLIGVQRSVVRNNKLTNRLWKCMEVFTTRKGPERKSTDNLIEGNVFDSPPCSSIQYAGNRSILRRNVFARCRTGMNFAHYKGRAKTPEAWYDRDNRFYANVIYDCGSGERSAKRIAELENQGARPAEPVGDGAGMTFATNIPPYKDYGGQAFVNNIIFRNHHSPGGETEPTTQIVFTWDAGPKMGGIFRGNDIMAERPGQKVVFWMDAKCEKPKALPQNFTLKEFEAAFPDLAAGNTEADPQFVDPDKGDFRLKAGSPCIDAGCALTKAAEAGKGKAVRVEDATFFCDGFGIVEPDALRVGAERVRAVKVDCEKNTITLDREIAWDAGAPVTLDYEGKAPDIGAFESGGKEKP